MDPILENMLNQSGVLAVLGLLAFLLGRYGLPVAREFARTMERFTTEVARLRENIEEQSEWLRYFLGRMNGVAAASQQTAPKAREGAQ